MGEAYKPVSQALSKPRGNMDDPNHLQALAQWASSNGDSQAASMYMQQARQAQAEQKEKEEQEKAELKSAAANAATFQYKTALETGDADTIAKAESALLANAVAHNYDGMQRMSAASTHVRNQQDQDFQQAERQRQAEERANNEAFMAKMNGTESTEEIQAIVDDAAPELQATAQQAATRRLQYLESAEARRSREAENSQIIDTDINIPTDTAVLPEALQKQYSAELKQLEKEVEDSKVNGTWEPTTRRRLQRRRDVLESKVSEAATRNILNQESEARAAQRAFDNKRQSIAIDNPTTAEAAEIKKELEAASEEANEAKSSKPDMFVGSDNITDEMVIAEFRRRQYASLEAVRPGGPQEQAAPSPSETRTFTDAEESRIAQAMAQNPGKTREQVIAKLYPNTN
jgi:hypothetical protein